MRRGATVACFVAALLAALPATGQDKTFRWSFQGDVGMMDPYGLFESMTIGFLGNIYEGLVRRDGALKIEPGLATAWERVDDTVWRFTLRRDVRFHDGTPFTADDVLFSFDRIRGEGSDFHTVVATIDEIQAVDPHTIVIVTDGPDPVLLSKLEVFFIMSRAWAEANGAEQPSDVRKGVENYATRHANGTGPFRLVSRAPDIETVLEANPDWWDTPGHSVGRAVFTPIGADATRIAALLSGKLDMAYPVPLQDIRRVERTPGVTVLQGPELRTIFLGMDQSRDTLLYSNVPDANPFKDVRVRQAFYQAIDIEAIHRKIMRGASTPTGLMVAPGVNGFDAGLNDRTPYDPDAARALLAEAGYGDGFEVGMDCPNDRYVNDESICQAVAAGLARIGVTVNLLAQTKSKFFAKVLARDTSFYLLGWTPSTIDAHEPLFSLTGTPQERGQGKFNLGGYSNPDLDTLIAHAGIELNPKARQRLISQAMAVHKADYGHIPLHQQALAWGVREGITVAQRPDNMLHLRWVTMP